MKYRILGKTGLRLSEVGIGCWEAGGAFWKTTDEQAMEAFNAAVKSGITFFDTALDYGEGHSEQLVGKFAKENPKLIIATKVPPKDQHWPAVDKNVQNVFPKDYILEYAMKSYKNLGERTIDLLQLHVWKDEWTDEPCWREAFDELRAQGIARHFGVSINDHSPASALKLVRSGKVESVQVIYNIFDQSPEDELFPECIKNKVGVIARVPFDEGSLAGKFTENTKFADWRKDYFTPERLKEVVRKVEGLRWLENPNRTLAQAALQFCLHHPAVTTVIPGSTNSKHVEQNALASNGSLSAEELNKLRANRWVRNFYMNY
jgi:aryl-alcohol dehydrogenase-like predicted oxidoreductase